jgi:peptide/nickel transport system ATP-binding protein
MTTPVLQVEKLSVALPSGGDRTHAVSAVSFDVKPAQLTCLVGESGSGKSIIAHTVMGLLPRNIRATSGEVRMNGEDLRATSMRMRQLRGAKMSMRVKHGAARPS